jgi:hypothetical protein
MPTTATFDVNGGRLAGTDNGRERAPNLIARPCGLQRQALAIVQ